MKMPLLKVNIFIINCLCLPHVTNLKFHLQEDGRRVCSNPLFYPQDCLYCACKTHYNIPVCTTVFLKMSSRFRFL